MEHFQKPFLKTLPEFGIELETYSGFKMYHDGVYNDSIKKSLERAPRIREIFNQYRKHPLKSDWLPYNPICSECGRVNTKMCIRDRDMIVVEDDKTPTAFVLTDNNHDQIFYFYWGAATRFKKSEIPHNAIKNTRSVHLATGDPSFNLNCGKFARKEGKIISFDPGQDLHMYSPNDLWKVLEVSDILFGNHHEVKRILKTLDMSVDELREFGPSIVVETRGRNGSVIYSDETNKVNALERDPVDPTGAGDSYRAGFLKSYLEGKRCV